MDTHSLIQCGSGVYEETYGANWPSSRGSLGSVWAALSCSLSAYSYYRAGVRQISNNGKIRAGEVRRYGNKIHQSGFALLTVSTLKHPKVKVDSLAQSFNPHLKAKVLKYIRPKHQEPAAWGKKLAVIRALWQTIAQRESDRRELWGRWKGMRKRSSILLTFFSVRTERVSLSSSPG